MHLSQRLKSEMYLISSSILSLPSLLAHIWPWITWLESHFIWNPECVQRGSRAPKLRDKVNEGSWPWPTQRSRDSKGTVKKLSLWTANKESGTSGRIECVAERKWAWEGGHTSAPWPASSPRWHHTPVLKHTGTSGASRSPSSWKRMHETLPHAAPQFADSIHPPPLLGLPVYVVTWFHYLFLALISEAFILLGFGRVSTASFWALKSSLYKPGLRPSGDRALVWATSRRLFILLAMASPGGAGVPHRPAGTVATNTRKKHDLRFHLAQPSLSNGETETQRSKSWAPRLSLKVIESDPKLWALCSLLLCPIH